jgi:hypothetical protein
VSKPIVNAFRSRVGPLLIAALIMEACYAAVLLARSPGEQITLVLLAAVVNGMVFTTVLLWLWRSDMANPATAWTVGIVTVAGFAFRLTVMPLPNATSPDVNRYLWEGVIQSRGFNPYVLAPSAPELQGVADEFPALAAAARRPEIHPHVPSIYPPVAQSLFLANAAVFDGALWGWKVILLLFDIVLLMATLTILRDRAVSRLALIGVAWCPLLILECYEAAHLDVIGVSFVVLAIASLKRRQAVAAGALIGLAINVKYLWPALAGILLLPAAWRQRRGAVFAATAIGVAVACWIPYREGVAAAWDTARMFAEHWSFNGLAFEAIRDVVETPRWAPMAIVLSVLTILSCVLVMRGRDDPWSDVWLIGGTALLLSPVAYPWYFLWLVPGLALRPPAWLLVWVVSVPILHVVDWHHTRHGVWDAMPWLWGVVLVAPGLLLLQAWWRRVRHAAVPGAE